MLDSSGTSSFSADLKCLNGVLLSKHFYSIQMQRIIQSKMGRKLTQWLVSDYRANNQPRRRPDFTESNRSGALPHVQLPLIAWNLLKFELMMMLYFIFILSVFVNTCIWMVGLNQPGLRVCWLAEMSSWLKAASVIIKLLPERLTKMSQAESNCIMGTWKWKAVSSMFLHYDYGSVASRWTNQVIII